MFNSAINVIRVDEFTVDALIKVINQRIKNNDLGKWKLCIKDGYGDISKVVGITDFGGKIQIQRSSSKTNEHPQKRVNELLDILNDNVKSGKIIYILGTKKIGSILFDKHKKEMIIEPLN